MAGSDDRSLDLRLPWGRSGAVPEAVPTERREEARAGDLAAGHEPAAAISEPVEAQAPSAPGAAMYSEGTDRLAADVARLDERLERIQVGFLACFDRLAEQADAHETSFEARLEQLESRLASAHTASMEAVGLLAGQVVARLEEETARIEAGLQQRHEELAARVGADHGDLVRKLDDGQAATLEVLGGLASGQLVDRLLEGIVATGEVLDAELVELRRLLSERPSTPLAAAPAARKRAPAVPARADEPRP